MTPSCRSNDRPAFRWLWLPLFGALTAVTAAGACADRAGDRNGPALDERGEPNLRNAAIADAASPAEDLIEAALSADHSLVEDRLASLASAWKSEALPSEVRQAAELDRRLAGIRDSVSAGAWPGVALASVEAYRALVTNQDTAALHVPLPVALLDYSGFRLAALMSAGDPDWDAIGSTVAETRDTWMRIRDRVSDTGLRDLMDTVVAGLEEASGTRNEMAVKFGSQVTLDAVDLLEHYFVAGSVGA